MAVCHSGGVPRMRARKRTHVQSKQEHQYHDIDNMKGMPRTHPGSCCPNKSADRGVRLILLLTTKPYVDGRPESTL